MLTLMMTFIQNSRTTEAKTNWKYKNSAIIMSSHKYRISSVLEVPCSLVRNKLQNIENM